ncbi:MAG: bifunctional ornithine acetyltransferase/N-acetylglutamate synthase [Acidiphilium sp. 37-64-53]|uniref:bifunctional glutamate N-acetyltransferase/amino-acid acetyltransferase ArgJ n=1 Tax=Acidiphilium TaxID=522 RepID=UPI000BDD1861|nr:MULTISPECIES: bifunctional glutamate N-acetyltransferase/amino-acid acetyltransferase ArgJ [Acidiphilium]OYW01139.1 MAG: bifunctional ornithine acetyltransferase/N-acetylglutamate synthase [Acidiphilium sp. 37-64-53]OZB25162.1 MAG: bifunctional ornithine acetyltransferase/N-acetylglutamate synthase [Acidiphilium sp. 34-64-41]HQT86149.1 bifunctional glutamate N-acetyltransferase/amino-acid acetyltransferase ArgJ [Acidiphilium rubrum]
MAKKLAVSPLALPLPDLPAVGGVRFATVAAGIRYRGRTDVLLADFAPGTTVAGVFTRNKCPGAPVTWCRDILPRGLARGLLVNAGNANVFNGAAGAAAVRASAVAAARALKCAPEEIFLASTGVIGEPMPTEKITSVTDELAAGLSADGWKAAASAIMTTDTFPKAATRTTMIGGTSVRITGIAKGSGMIAPDMATMLAFVVTDAAIPAPMLQTMLLQSIEPTFNCITVDSDTSTSDTVLLFATGAAGNALVARTKDLKAFRLALLGVLHDLAQMVIRDGEGARKLIEITVTGAVSRRSARRVGLAIANSPLVKTAVAGEDANWGRIVMAVGKAGEPAERDRLAVAVGGVWMAREGRVVDGYQEAPVVTHMGGSEIKIAVDLGMGRGSAVVWGCDLTHGYIDINGSYRS